MSGTTGKSKDTSEKDGFRQFVVNCLGENDQRKYFSLSPFGYDCNLPENTKALTLDSKNKDDKFLIGILNKVWLNDLSKGEKIVFSTSEDGETIKSFIRFNNDGTMHQNGDADNIAGFAKLKEGFDTLKTDLNNLITAYNTHIHITTATVGATPTPGVIAPTTSTGTSSNASIDDSKKDNLKTE